ncbi:porin family protein [Limibacter armeniacum]|uniref:porin family protein n=1 Tax=Limibacter armeniacum TaxID=466084 RepID=UPI002FE62859
MKKLFALAALLFVANVTFAQVPSNLPGNFYFDLGLAMLDEEPFDLETQSRGINISYMYEFTLGSEKFTFHPGLGYGHESYFFDDDITLGKVDGKTVGFPISEGLIVDDVKKTKLAVNYIDVPLEFRFRTHPGKNAFRIGVGVKGGVLFDAHTKVKYEVGDDNQKLKNKADFNLNRFRAGGTLRIGYGAFNVFGYYSFTNLFEDDAFVNFSDDTRTIVVGLTLSSF